MLHARTWLTFKKKVQKYYFFSNTLDFGADLVKPCT